MKIVIVGDGKVGFALAQQLSHEGHDITVIEDKAQVLNNTMNMLDVVGVQGNGANYEVLVEANAAEADVLIAATSTDEVNIICCMLAKKMGTSNTIARIRNPEYIKSVQLMKEELGLSMRINPEQAAAMEIMRSIRFTSSIKVSSFAKGTVELAEIKVRQNNPMIGLSLSKVRSIYHSQILFCAIQRNEEVIIPNGDTVIMENDRVSLTGSLKELENFFSKIGISDNHKVQQVMIVGGGRISFYLTHMLLDLGVEVTIIEKNKERCLQLAEKFPAATIIFGDGTDHELLRSESLEEMDAFVALTDNDEENVIVSMFAANQGINTVLPKVNRVSLGFLLERLGLENTITPKSIITHQIVQYVRAMQNSLGSNVESLIKIIEDKEEVLELRDRENCKFIGVLLKDLQLKPGILVAYITHRGVPKTAHGGSYVQLHDSVIIISCQEGLRDINDVLA